MTISNTIQQFITKCADYNTANTTGYTQHEIKSYFNTFCNEMAYYKDHISKVCICLESEVGGNSKRIEKPSGTVTTYYTGFTLTHYVKPKRTKKRN